MRSSDITEEELMVFDNGIDDPFFVAFLMPRMNPDGVPHWMDIASTIRQKPHIGCRTNLCSSTLPNIAEILDDRDLALHRVFVRRKKMREGPEMSILNFEWRSRYEESPLSEIEQQLAMKAFKQAMGRDWDLVTLYKRHHSHPHHSVRFMRETVAA